MKVEFLVDIVSRDTPVAASVCGSDHGETPDCLIAPTFFADGEKRWTLTRSRRYGADVLVTPWYNAARTLEIFSRARLAGARLVHYPSEQIFSRLFDHEKLNTACAAAYCRHVDAVLVWGEYYARRLVEDVGYPRERIYEVGSPRLEFARSGHPDESERGAGPRRVLFVSDFTIADLQDERQRRAFASTYGVPVTADTVTRLDAARRYMLDTACRVAQTERFEVRVRPHPGERSDVYHAACDGTGVQYADPAGTFSADILWADVVVGYTTTSLFEVIAAGRPFFALRNEPPPEIVWREIMESLYRVYSADELMEALRDPSALEAAHRDLIREATICVGNIDSAYDPVAALRAALRDVPRRHAATTPGWGDRCTMAWGVVRAACKYVALRLFTSKMWCALGLWQPAAVRRRLSPAHALTDEVVARYRKQTEQESTAAGRGPETISWELGRWCWRPVARAATEHAMESGAAVAER